MTVDAVRPVASAARRARAALGGLTAAMMLIAPHSAQAQSAPSTAERSVYKGLHAAVAKGDRAAIAGLIAERADLNARDGQGRTPLMLAGHRGDAAAARALIKAGADINALDKQRYDFLTIVAVRGDLPLVKLAIASGAKTNQITSPYDGTALIASAHRGHVAVVKALIDAKAPLDHVNNLGWTALIEAIVLGDGGKRHTAIVRLLVAAGANVDLADKHGTRPLTLARERKFAAMVKILEAAGAKP